MWFTTIQQASTEALPGLTAGDTRQLLEAMSSLDPAALPRAVLGLLRTEFPVAHCAVFTFLSGSAPVLCYEASLPEREPLPSGAGLAYMAGHFRFDALTKFIDAMRSNGGDEVIAFEQSRADIVDPRYRLACYQRCSVSDRLSLIVGTGDLNPKAAAWLAINLYRLSGADPFTDHDVDRVRGLLCIVAAFVRTHYLLRRPASRINRSEPVAVVLSPREAQVADLVASGLSSKSIAKVLGILPSTVTTLRRRAYDKLGVSTGCELSAKWAHQ